MTQDAFAKYRLNQSPRHSPEEVPSLPSSTSNIPEDTFSKFRISNPQDTSEEEGFLKSLPRHAARIGSRVVETIGGIPGDIADLIQSGVFYGLEKAIGYPVTEEQRKAAAIKSERPPTSSELEDISQKLTKGYTKPIGKIEESVDEYAKTVASLLGPMKFRKALGVAALGTGAKKAAEISGLGKGTQEAAKLGTIVLASMFNPTGVKQLYSNYYQEASKLAPEGTRVSSKLLESRLNHLQKKLSEGILAPTEKAVLDDLKKVRGKIKNGQVEVREMMATNRSINERMGDPELLKRGKNLYGDLKKAVSESINSYNNPEFLKNWKSANEAFAGLHESQKMSRWIHKALGNKPILHAAVASGAEAALGHPEAIPFTLGGAIGGYGSVKGIELMQRIMSNPTLRKYYANMLLGAAKEDSSLILKSAKKLEDSLTHSRE